MKNDIAPREIEKVQLEIRRLSNRGRFQQAYKLAKFYYSRYPHVVRFAYYEAVYAAEDTSGLSPRKAAEAHRQAARKLKAVTRRLRGEVEGLRASVRNEYYWFSAQPLKQYRLGVELVGKGLKRYYYSMGVGSAQLAEKHLKKGRAARAVRWAKISEKAWLKFFAQDPNWFNSYLFYAKALAYQGKMQEMEKALARAAKIARKPLSWKVIAQVRGEIEGARK